MYSSSNFPLALYFIAISLLMHLPALPHSAAFQALQNHTVEARDWQLKELFGTTPDRFSRFSLEAAGLFLDYSKNRVDPNTMHLLCDLARERGVEPAREALFTGEKVNTTEHRAALHTALRMPRTQTLMVDGHNVGAEVHQVLDRIKQFTDRVRSGEWLGHSGKPITDIINIGIGGSDLGPKMVTLALRAYGHPRLRMHFVSNVDGHDLDAVLTSVNP